MSDAVVGDDVYGEDPTVNLLEERSAERLGREAALLVPSGTMGNQIAVHLLSKRGHEVIGEVRCHIFNYEVGAMAAISGVLPRPIDTEDGILGPEQVREAYRPAGGYTNTSSMLVLENTHNLAGGRVVPEAGMRALVATASELGLPVHLDGARIFNACAALDCSPASIAAGCTTVMFCLSKGLGAPVGSLRVGDRDLITEARRVRKMLGGGMRQAGVIAAAGLVALEEMVPRLHEDHAAARRLAELLAGTDGIELDPAAVETNIVCCSLTAEAPVSAAELAARLADEGVLIHALGANLMRFVTHYHITHDDVDFAAHSVEKLLTESQR
jgi:threonine aldolase